MSDVLVTGSSGAVGRRVCAQLLEQGYSVAGADLSEAPEELRQRDGFDAVELDITDEEAVNEVFGTVRPGRVVHAAAILPLEATADPHRAWIVNVAGTAHIAHAVERFAVVRLVFTSTKGVLSDFDGDFGHPTYTPIDENYPVVAPINAHTNYNSTKVACEHLLNKFHQLKGISVAILRFANMYGPGRVHHGPRSLAGDILERCHRGEDVHIPSGGDERMDLLYLKDVATAVHRALMADDLSATTFNIGTGQGWTLKDVGRVVNDLIPDARIEIGDGLDPYDYGRRTYCIFSTDRARQELGYEPAFDLSSGFEDYLQLLRQDEAARG